MWTYAGLQLNTNKSAAGCCVEMHLKNTYFTVCNQCPHHVSYNSTKQVLTEHFLTPTHTHTQIFPRRHKADSLRSNDSWKRYFSLAAMERGRMHTEWKMDVHSTALPSLLSSFFHPGSLHLCPTCLWPDRQKRLLCLCKLGQTISGLFKQECLQDRITQNKDQLYQRQQALVNQASKLLSATWASRSRNKLKVWLCGAHTIKVRLLNLWKSKSWVWIRKQFGIQETPVII